MTGSRLRPAFFVGLFLGLLAVALQEVQSEELEAVPPEDLCRPYIEKALKDLGTGSLVQISAEVGTEGEESHEEGEPPGSEEQADEPGSEVADDGSQETAETEASLEGEGDGSKEETAEEGAAASDEQADDQAEKASAEDEQADASAGESVEAAEDAEEGQSAEVGEEGKDTSAETVTESEEAKVDEEDAEQQSAEGSQDDEGQSKEAEGADAEGSEEQAEGEGGEGEEEREAEGVEDGASDEVKSEEKDETTEDDGASKGDEEDSGADEGGESKGDETEADSKAEGGEEDGDSQAEEGGESAAASDEEVKVEEDESKAGEEASKEDVEASKEGEEGSKEAEETSKEGEGSTEGGEGSKEGEGGSQEEGEAAEEADQMSGEKEEGSKEEDTSQVEADDAEASKEVSDEDATKTEEDKTEEETSKEADKVSAEGEEGESQEKTEESPEEGGPESKEREAEESREEEGAGAESTEDEVKSAESEADEVKTRARREVGEAPSEEATESTEAAEGAQSAETAAESEEQEPTPEEDLIEEIVVPEHLRPRDHIDQLLKVDEENEGKERAIENMANIILRDLKRLYDNAIQPLETLYKYRDLSNRHFGDPEIFSKPLILFMGPWSGGKSSIINYLLDIEYKHTSLRTGAEPSPAYFNIIMHGEEEEVLDGTQLAADWTFSGLQKFGQGLLDRLRGLKLNNKLLEKVNIVEIPGILEVRKQVQRVFPFNDACQWFIDRADIIFLVYDPSKLDVGPETEAILDQLKGREYQTRIILNKADQVKPEELMRVQGALIWNISPLMSSAEPPVMYSTSLWSLPYEAGAPTRLLYAQERAFLRDLRSAIDKRVEHKIASARRFAVRVRNHAKMVDCYLTTYYNHKTFFGNKKEISDKIIENPQDYHIYEGLSTLTNISRYDLPDPDVYRDFFRLNALYDFQQLSATCTYFRGCPINRLDVAIAYDLPELVGKYKKSVEAVMHENEASSPLS